MCLLLDEEKSRSSTTGSECDGEDNVVTQVVSEVIESSKTIPPLETPPSDAQDTVADMEVSTEEKSSLPVHALNDSSAPFQNTENLPVPPSQTTSIEATNTGTDVEMPTVDTAVLSNKILDDGDLSTTTENSIVQCSETSPVNASDDIADGELSAKDKTVLPLTVVDDGDMPTQTVEKKIETSSLLPEADKNTSHKGKLLLLVHPN